MSKTSPMSGAHNWQAVSVENAKLLSMWATRLMMVVVLQQKGFEREPYCFSITTYTPTRHHLSPGSPRSLAYPLPRNICAAAKVEVTGDFKLVDQPVALVLATLGLPYSTLVKVRRRCSPGDAGARTGVFKAADGKGVGGGSGGGSGDGSETCSLAPGDEESSWAGGIGGGPAGRARSKRVGGGRGPFALRRRTYQLLENDDGEERAVRTPVAVGPRIEMATLRAEGATGTAREGGGKPATARAGGAQSLATVEVEDLYDVSPDARVRAGDVLVLSAARDSLVYASGSVFGGARDGLRVLGVSTLGVGVGPPPPPRRGRVFFELVLSRSSRFLGRTARLDNGFFAARYGCSVVAFRLKGCAGGGVDLVGSGAGSSGCGGGGDGGAGGEPSAGGDGCEDSEESNGSLLKTVDAAGSPNPSVVAAAATATVGAVAEDRAGEVFSLSGDGSLGAVGTGASPRYSPAPTPSLSSFAGNDGNGSSPTMVPVSLPGEPVLEPKQQQFHWRRRRGEAFEAGDVVMVLATEQFAERNSSAAKEFLRKELVGRLPEPTGWSHVVPLAIFALMLLWVLLEGVEMVSGNGGRYSRFLTHNVRVLRFLKRFGVVGALRQPPASCAVARPPPHITILELDRDNLPSHAGSAPRYRVQGCCQRFYHTSLPTCLPTVCAVQIRAVFAACGVLLVGGWVDAKQAAGHVNWGLLLLIGSALGFSKAMANSGLADMAGRVVRESGMSESASLYALFGLTMVSSRSNIGRFVVLCTRRWRKMWPVSSGPRRRLVSFLVLSVFRFVKLHTDCCCVAREGSFVLSSKYVQ